MLYKCHDDKQLLPSKSEANTSDTAAKLIQMLLLTTTRRNGLRYGGDGLIESWFYVAKLYCTKSKGFGNLEQTINIEAAKLSRGT